MILSFSTIAYAFRCAVCDGAPNPISFGSKIAPVDPPSRGITSYQDVFIRRGIKHLAHG